jgi:hypothetical protein
MTPGADAKRAYAVEAGGAATESMGGVAVIVLSILCLAGVLPRVLAPIAGIVFGAAFIVEGAAIAARFRTLAAEVAGDRGGEFELGGGMTVELVAGAAAVILGILALVGIVPRILVATLVIVGGAGLILSAGAIQRMHSLRATQTTSGAYALTSAAVTSAAAAQVLAGLGAGVVGILALVNVGNPVALISAGLLVLGASITLSGTALSTKMLRLFRPA